VGGHPDIPTTVSEPARAEPAGPSLSQRVTDLEDRVARLEEKLGRFNPRK
jgi:hypothetical protein